MNINVNSISLQKRKRAVKILFNEFERELILIEQKFKKVFISILSVLIIVCFPLCVQAVTIDTSIEGYTKILDMMKTYVKGAGGIVLMIGCGDFFLSLTNDSTERLVKAMQTIGAGFFLIIADSFLTAIGKADGSQTFTLLFNMISMIISFIGAVLAMLGAYRIFNSVKEKNPEIRSKAIKVFFSGMMLIVVSQSVSAFVY